MPTIAGVDEAGRGPLAGPVVAAAVLLPEHFQFDLLDDSKKLTPEQRQTAELVIKASAVFSVVAIGHEDIDRLNILNATMVAMQLALERLTTQPKAALIDGNRVPPLAPVPCSAMIKGDGIYASIAAASILAKVERDRLMTAYAADYPEYGFDRHFGYATREHFSAIRKYGPCPIHRRSFDPVRTMVLQPCLLLAD